jgi:hypothetical protein
VWALVRDVGKARGMLAGLPAGGGASLELVAADITQRATLLPHMFAGVRQLVCCTAVKVAPKEGDTQDRSKYYQVGGRGGRRLFNKGVRARGTTWAAQQAGVYAGREQVHTHGAPVPPGHQVF